MLFWLRVIMLEISFKFHPSGICGQAFKVSNNLFQFQMDGKLFHNFPCYDQSCDGQESGLCGSGRMRSQFADFLSVLGTRSIEYLEHVEVTYTRADFKKVHFDSFYYHCHR